MTDKTTEALKLAGKALGCSQQHLDLYHPEWLITRQQNDKALAAIREVLAEKSKCACDSPAWCNQYKKCNREILGLPIAEPVKQEVTDVLNVALEALVYHTEQTRPIHKTDEAISQIQNFLDKGATK